MKILNIVTNDPAGMAIAFTNAINRTTPHTARLVARGTAYRCDFERDLLLSDMGDGDYGEVEALLREADVLHFHNLFHEGMTLGPIRVRDYAKGKLIVHHEHGHYDFLADVDRWRAIYLQPGRVALVSTPDLLRQLPEATWIPNPVPVNDPVFLPRPDAHGTERQVRVVQAPTRRWDKNTAEFLEVARELGARHPGASFELLENLAYAECLRRKRGASAVFDHMRGHFGVSSLESLSQGVPVVAGLDDWNLAAIREFTGVEDTPWVLARNRGELRDRLEELIVDPAARAEIGAASRRFMVERWNERRIVDRLLAAYGGLAHAAA